MRAVYVLLCLVGVFLVVDLSDSNLHAIFCERYILLLHVVLSAIGHLVSP